MKKKFIKMVLLLTLFISLVMIPSKVYAHDINDYTLDTWNETGGSDVQFQNWFYEEVFHMPESLGTSSNPVKYYFSDMGRGSESHLNLSGLTYQKGTRYIMWSNIVPMLRKGIEKWNHVYFRDGSIDKRLVYLEETTSVNNANIIFYPSVAKSTADTYINLDYSIEQAEVHPGTTEYVEESCVDAWSSTFSSIESKHCSKYDIIINYREIFKNLYVGLSYDLFVSKIEKIGTHEIGHVLGLGDINNVRSVDNSNSAHIINRPDLIMSREFSENHTIEIPYKEIAGVAIFRGIHTEGEHQWLEENFNNQTRYKCVICNGTTGVRPNGTIIEYGHSSEGSHTHTDSDLIIVGKIEYPKYGNHVHYYKKCQYCSYVEVTSNNISRKYTFDSYHVVECNDCNMEWQQQHHFEYISANDDSHTKRCEVCNYTGSQMMHSYEYIYLDETKHLSRCTVCDFSEYHIHNYQYDEILNKNICNDCGYIN